MGTPAKRIRRWLHIPPDQRTPGGQLGNGLSAAYLARISMMGMGFTALALSFTIHILPARIEDVAPEGSKNSYLGILSFVGLLVAVLMQPLAGGLSDRRRSRWGRRTPFIVAGTVAGLPFLVAAGVAPTYVLLFVFICLLQFFSNSAMGPYQALIRDLVPRERRGAASGIKMLVEVAGAGAITVLVGLFIDRYDNGGDSGWLWASMALLAAVVLIGAATTAGAAREPELGPRRPEEEAPTLTRAHPDFKWFLLSRFLLAISLASVATFARFFLEDSVGLEHPARALTIMMVVVGASFFLVSYPAGVIADKTGRMPVMAAGGVLAAMGFLVLIAATSLVGVIISGVLAGLAIGLILGPNWAMATDLVSVGRTAQQMGYLNLAAAGGAGVARLNGLWVDRLNTGDGDLGYSTMFGICAILVLVGTLVLILVRSDQGLRNPGSPVPGDPAVQRP